MKKATILLFLILCSLFTKVQASHLMGGEITWECLSTGRYIFTMKIYRDCNGSTIGSGGQSLTVSNGPISTIPMNFVFPSRDISPQCYDPSLQKSCGAITAGGTYGTVNFPNNNGAVEELVFKSNPVLLSGVPGPNGWVFSWSLCCRNSAITNLSNPGSAGFCLRAKMFRYNNPSGTGKNTNPCFDSSPTFAERPSTIICTGFPFTYNHNAYDKELDSLTYAWDKPLEEFTGGTFSSTNPAAVGFAGGYTFTSPLPGITQDPNNIPATINPQTGEISYTSFTQGNFVTVVKVTAYKCGQKVAEIYRELQVVLLPCGAGNNPPTITAPFPGNTYNKTVLAGDTVIFDLYANDPDLLPNGNLQTVSITASGGQFDTLTYDTSSVACNKPPCAGLFPPPPILSQGTAHTKFVWVTNCNHISYLSGCSTYSNVYTFLITYRDDYCPAPALKIKTITIKVLAKAIIKAPSPRCTKVAANGDVTLSWVAPKDTDNTFDAYILYSSNSPAGPFTAIDSLEKVDNKSLDSTTYTHIGANANVAPVYYCLKSRSGCWGRIYSAFSDTICSMKLTATNIGNNQASLVWNPISRPLLTTSIPPYKVWRKVNNIWAQIGTTTDTTYLDTIAVCDEIVEYRVELADSACNSVSSLGSDHFTDTVVPDTPVLTKVSVNTTTDLAEITWAPVLATDTKGYYIYQYAGGAFTLIDSVMGINSTFYLYNLSQAVLLPESYGVAAFDSCHNTSPISTTFTTINLINKSDVCSGSNNLTWTAYSNFINGVDSYEIYYQTNFGGYSFLASVDASTFNYKHVGLTNGTIYDYYVLAKETGTGLFSTSNHVSQLASVLILPQFTYLRYATVTDDKQIDLAFFGDSVATVSYYKVMRANDINGPYQQIGQVDSSSANATHYYTDLNVDVDVQSYFYKIITVDSCGVDGSTSNAAKTILLRADENIDLKNLIKWSDYIGWSTGVNDVKLFRYVNQTFNPQPIAFIPYATNEYVDDVGDFTASSGEFCYSVMAREAPGNIYSFADSSQSNVVCFNQQSTIYIPNAFSPTGSNPVFKPHFVFVNTDGYLMRIFNKWGDLMFETTSPEKGWDGKVNGEIVPQGVYVYVMKYKNTAGASFEKRGAVTIIK